MSNCDTSDLVTINAVNYHQMLTHGLWNSFLSKRGVDLDLVCGGRSIGTHRLLLDLFLSSDKLQETAADVQQGQDDDYSVLESLLEFLYTGQLTVARERLNSLLTLAMKSDFSLLVDALRDELLNVPANCHTKARSENVNHRQKSDNRADINPENQFESTLYQELKISNAFSLQQILHGHPTLTTKRRMCQSAVKATCPSPNLISDSDFECTGLLNSGASQLQSELSSSPPPDLLLVRENRTELMPPIKIKTEHCREDDDTAVSSVVQNTKSTVDPLRVAVKLEQDWSAASGYDDCCNQSVPTQKSDQFELVPKLEEFADSDADNKDNSESDSDEINSPDVEESYDLDASIDASQSIASTSKLGHLQDPKSGTTADSSKNTKNWQHKCPVCAKRFQCHSHVIPHLNTHTGIKPYRCSVCKRTFSQRTHLKSHMRTHTGEKPYKCKVCQRAFAQGSSLEQHMRIHTGEKPYICLVCSKAFRQDCDVRRHLKTHETELAAQKCETSRESENRLLRRVRSKEMKLSTPAAMVEQTEPAVAAFKRDPQSLMRNKKLIDNNRLKCPNCSKVFTRSAGLKRHIRTHTGERPYKCDVCLRTFSVSSSLICHSRVHTGEKPYKCNVCAMAFGNPITLKRHTLIHTGEKPYKCTLCPMSSRTSQNFKRHLRTHAAKTS